MILCSIFAPANSLNSYDMIAEHLTNRPRKVYTSTVILTATRDELFTLAGCLLRCPLDERDLGRTKDHVIDVLLTELSRAIRTIDSLQKSENDHTEINPRQDRR